MIDKIYDYIISHGKIIAWCLSFIIIFIIVTLLCLSLFVIFTNCTFMNNLYDAIGCGLGTALINAFRISSEA